MMLRLALSALLFGGLSGPLMAADLGKAGVQDLEERVADLEATVARKGNRKVTVTVYGQINKAILFASDELGPRQHGVIDNSASPTFFGLEGKGKIAKDWMAGYRLELGVDSTRPIPLLDNDVQVRHSYLWLEGPMGKFSLGHTSMASDNITRITVANTAVASPMLSLAPLSTVYFLGFDLPFNDLRRNLIRWDSPLFGGFQIAASYANGDTAFSSLINSGFNPDHAWDVALRWSTEIKEGGGWRIAAGIGYRDENFVVNASPISFLPFTRDRVYSGSASVMNIASGLFLSGAAARVQGETLLGGTDFDAFQLQGGWEKKLTSLGKTTIYAEWGQIRVDGASTHPFFFGGGVVQSIDAVAMDLYLAVKRIDTDNGAPEVTSGMAGMRIRF